MVGGTFGTAGRARGRMVGWRGSFGELLRAPDEGCWERGTVASEA
jgi:hypothetical protein